MLRFLAIVVYLLIPTSNHNSIMLRSMINWVVYLLIPTSNHNLYCDKSGAVSLYIFWFLHQTTTWRYSSWYVRKLYIFWFLHQTTTSSLPSRHGLPLYIFWFLHQTTTASIVGACSPRCISFDSYIKPQPTKVRLTSQSVVYLLIPTSNHNGRGHWWDRRKLYIFWFLHQTTTYLSRLWAWWRCISFDSYIKPQQMSYQNDLQQVVYLLIPTSNHNPPLIHQVRKLVVYLLIPTSNHN